MSIPVLANGYSSIEAPFNLIIHRPRIAGGRLSIPIDSRVRLVKCRRREAAHNTIRLRYGKTRECLVVRASNSLERSKWQIALIQAMAAAQDLEKYTAASTAPVTTSSKSAPTSRSATMTREQVSRMYVENARAWSKPTTALRIYGDVELLAAFQLPFAYTVGTASSTTTCKRKLNVVPGPGICGSVSSDVGSQQPGRYRQEKLCIATQFLVAIGQTIV
ncbi:hypothetical protein PHYSODRAFT_293435 [Phytophthora sojae]|uniref:PH domain-containing protein n=1 Tax=Phytophthora sojae (strain P6497) TaxID=1094619 RepID=G4YFT4_PHYSP|nr:hypothetical protein PHYSODRAFT_293435 [Phytophthora sojae]EGZ27661.1 hypothetical protein PHYSODRAFT_293435 [Phytophthora sojae]|eukprot:XP_009514936.1 hypothetical protein PHYSODRAFT_293435 [Phytophthora sojae]